tara:strand:- start:35 stop:862 length:828 start_codon:yes stop_codon:yes gene_type:complete
MYSIIGLGNCGCNIAKKFEYFPQYTVYYIDTEQRLENNFGKMPKQDQPEKYEEGCPDFSSLLKAVDQNVCLIVGGSGYISAASLRILEKIKDRDINVLYIRPDIELLTGTRLLQEKVTFNVLQEYARSGLFKNIILVHNNFIGDIIGDVPINSYFESINETISSSFNMINVLSNSGTIVDSFSDLSEISRISTIGVMDISTGEEKLFYPLKNIQEKKYFYAISENDLETKGSLLRDITRQVKETSGDTKSGFGIFSTSYEQNYCYTLNYSSKIQN